MSLKDIIKRIFMSEEDKLIADAISKQERLSDDKYIQGLLDQSNSDLEEIEHKFKKEKEISERQQYLLRAIRSKWETSGYIDVPVTQESEIYKRS